MKTFGVVLIGVALLAGCSDDLGSSEPAIQTAGGGNSDCTVCCKALFPPGKDRGQCISAAAHHTGVCWCVTQCCVLDMSAPVPPPDLATTPRDLAGGDGGGGTIP
jgi:hypothetical protein